MSLQAYLQQVNQRLSEAARGRFAERGFEPEEIEDNCHIVGQFNQIAADMILQEGGIDVGNSAKAIPYDEHTGEQTLDLFNEAIVHALLKCDEFNITGDAKNQIMQLLALEVFNQAKQITAMTYGQEQTPDFQIPRAQQHTYMQQTADSHLIHFYGEYEKQQGKEVPKLNAVPEDITFDDPVIAPIPMAAPPTPEPLPEPTAQTPTAEDDGWFDDDDDLADDGWGETPAADSTPPASAPVELSEPPPPVAEPPSGLKPNSTHDKYAAVALLLGTLPGPLQGKILANFNADEQALIDYYQEPERIFQNLDVQAVEAHLRQFKQALQQGSDTLRSKAHRQIQKLAETRDKAQLMRLMDRERPRIKQYLETLYQQQRPDADAKPPQQGKHFSSMLPPHIEEHLSQYLAQHVQ